MPIASWQYARLIGEQHRTDVVKMRALNMAGQLVDTAFLLNRATSLLTESAPEAAEFPTPDNAAVRIHLLDRILLLTEEFDPASDQW